MRIDHFAPLGLQSRLKRGSCLSLTSWCAACLAALLVGCDQQEYSGPERFPLSGEVTYDGEPVDVGSISFLPAGNNQRVSGGYIENGKYSVPEAQGANAGKYRIEIRWQKLTGKKVRSPQSGEMEDQRAEGLPAKFHKDSELTVDVMAEKKTYDFHLKSQ